MVFVISRLAKRVGIGPIITLFAMCFIGNFIGSAFLGWLVVAGGSLTEASQVLILKVAAGKMALGAKEAFIRGILCNWLVCLAVWISLRTKSETARLIMIFWCLFAFIGSGFEHSIANQSLLSMAMFLPHGAEISVAGFINNQIFVTLGNLVGGGAFVGLVYWLATPSLRMEAGATLQEKELATKIKD
jgi:nitrite transporter NirC